MLDGWRIDNNSDQAHEPLRHTYFSFSVLYVFLERNESEDSEANGMMDRSIRLQNDDEYVSSCMGIRKQSLYLCLPIPSLGHP